MKIEKRDGSPVDSFAMDQTTATQRRPASFFTPHFHSSSTAARWGTFSSIAKSDAVAWGSSTRPNRFHSISNGRTEDIALGSTPRRTARTRRLPTHLRTIILKATAYDVHDRYQTAGDLAEDLRRFEKQRPITAIFIRVRARRWMQRNPSIMASIGGGVTLAFVMVLSRPRSSPAR